MAAPVDSERVKLLAQRELEAFSERNRKSLQLAQRGVEVMPAAVPTNVCAASPYPIAVAFGEGARVTDCDGNSYADYANGFGVSVWGHANPKIATAIAERAQRGVHFGTLTAEAVEWAEELVRRFGLDWVRFSNSGTEATMDAIRLARAKTGRTVVVKIEGAYHGSHEVALVSPNLSLDGTEGPDDEPLARPWGPGLSPRLVDEVRVLPFNDLEAAQRALATEQVACVITEPILFNVGAIFPEPGYLQGLRELCDDHGTLLIFDETKTAMTVARGGAEELFGAKPHIKTLGKGIGGGLACGALGDTDGACYELIHSFDLPHLGTFGGNPLAAAAGVAALGVMDEAAYEHLDAHRRYLVDGLERVIADYELPAYVVSAGAKGCVVWADPADGQLRDFRAYRRRFDFNLGYLAWVYLMNRGVFLAPGQDEQWTHSVAHSEREADAYVAAMDELGRELRG